MVLALRKIVEDLSDREVEMRKLNTTGKREERKLAMRPRWILIALLLVVILSVVVMAEKTKTVKLVVTDGGTGVLRWVRAVSIYPFDTVAKKRAVDPILKIDLPRDPVQFKTVPAGTYDITITVLRYGTDPILILLSRMDLAKDTVLDMRKIEIPYNLFIPS